MRPDEWDAFIGRECAGDEAIEPEVQGLLASRRESEETFVQTDMPDEIGSHHEEIHPANQARNTQDSRHSSRAALGWHRRHPGYLTLKLNMLLATPPTTTLTLYVLPLLHFDGMLMPSLASVAYLTTARSLSK